MKTKRDILIDLLASDELHVKQIIFHYSIETLSESGRKLLQNAWCVDDDPNHLWLNKGSEFYDWIYEECNEKQTIKHGEFPEWFWTLLNLPSSIRNEIEALWLINPNFEIHWL